MGNQCSSCNSCNGEDKLEFNDDETKAIESKLVKTGAAPTGKYGIHQKVIDKGNDKSHHRVFSN
jgi:hypothetical protein